MLLLAGVVAEVPDDQEVAGEALGLDDGQLALQPLLDLGRDLAIAALGAALAQAGEVILRRRAVRRVEPRGVTRVQVQLDIASLGDGQRVVAGLRRLREHLTHLVAALEIHVRRIDHPVRVVRQLARADGAQDSCGPRSPRVRENARRWSRPGRRPARSPGRSGLGGVRAGRPGGFGSR